MMNIRKQSGLSLVELMVTLVLGLILVSALVQIFVGNKQVENVEQALSRVQESGRFALDMIAGDIRMAGYYGCAINLPVDGTPVVSVIASGETAIADFTVSAVRGYERDNSGTWTPTLPTDLSAVVTGTDVTEARNNSDVVSVLYGQELGTGARLTADIAASASIPIDSNSGECLVTGDRAIISNCGTAPGINATATLFTVTGGATCGAASTLQHANSSNTSANLASPYKIDDRVVRLAKSTYFIADSGRTNPQGAQMFSLYRMSLDSGGTTSTEEMIEGVEFLRVLYGEELANGNLRYVTAENVTAPESIVSARIALLVQSFNSTLDANDARTYSMLGQDVTPAMHGGTRVMRRIFTTTVKIRNRSQRIL